MSELSWKDKLQLIGQLKRREKELFEALYHAFDGRQRYPIPIDEDGHGGRDSAEPEASCEEAGDAHISQGLELLDSIEQALRHADVRRFGKCIDCGAVISTKILRLKPWTLRCARHQGAYRRMRSVATGL